MTTNGTVWIDYSSSVEGWHVVDAATGRKPTGTWHSATFYEAHRRAIREGFTVVDTPQVTDVQQAAVTAMEVWRRNPSDETARAAITALEATLTKETQP